MQNSDLIITNNDYKLINSDKLLKFGIYILKRGDLLDTNIFKIGKTDRSLLTRYNEYNYPGTYILNYFPVNQCAFVERIIINSLKKNNNIIRRLDLGNEYFEGDYNVIFESVNNKCFEYIIEHQFNILELINYCNNNHKPTIKISNFTDDNILINTEENYVIIENDIVEEFITFFNFDNLENCANYFYNLNPDIFKYDNDHGWYYLNEYNVWKNAGFKKPVNMSKLISNCFQNMIIEYKKSAQNHLNKIKKSSKSDDEKNQYEKKYNDRIKFLNRQFVKCGSFSFTNDVFNFLSSLYHVDNILNLFDKNVNLFAFDDKVYIKNENIIRDIKPEDYICLTTGYKYPLNSDLNTRKQILNTIYSMFDNEKMTEYILYIFASAILGYNKFEKFYILTGLGGNGKGLISDIINQAFGNYFINVSNTIFTQKSKNKDNPLNEIVDSRYKRIMMTTEPENNETLLVGMIKKYTGGDVVQARNCFNKYVHNFKPPYLLFLQCNTIPKLSAIDKGIERRLTIINFPFQFKSIPNPLNTHDRQADCNIKKII
jgi:hypothetical protein